MVRIHPCAPMEDCQSGLSWCFAKALSPKGTKGSNPLSSSKSLCSSVWLERVAWDDEVAGSSPATETKFQGSSVGRVAAC